MNQVNVTAQAQGIKAIIVASETGKGLEADLQDVKYQLDLVEAMKVQEKLASDFPDIFGEKPPIISYDPKRTGDRLLVVPEERLQEIDRDDDELGWWTRNSPMNPPSSSQRFHL